MEKFGFIGTGNMGGALAETVGKVINPENIMLNDHTPEKAQALADKIGCKTGALEELVAFSDCIFVGVKPQALENLFVTLSTLLKKSAKRIVLVTMATGTSTEKIEILAGGKCSVIRIMPNVACSIGEGMTLCCKNEQVTDEEFDKFMFAMSKSGLCEEIPEKLIDAASAVSGCGPAFVFMMAEALADGAVACGVPRAKAYKFAAQTLAGSGKLILESGKTPAELKDSVCSPGGTTIEGVAKLEEGAFRGTVIDAVKASYEKNFNLK